MYPYPPEAQAQVLARSMSKLSDGWMELCAEFCLARYVPLPLTVNDVRRLLCPVSIFGLLTVFVQPSPRIIEVTCFSSA